MAKPLIVANWKMNPSTYGEAERLFSDVKSGTRGLRGVEVVIAPPFVWLVSIAGKNKKKVCLGAQNVFWEMGGAYTGEISPPMLKKSGVSYVIIGHSERRRFLGESDEVIARKVRAALKAGLIPIVAIGEELRDSQDAVPSVLAEQLKRAVEGVSSKDFKRIVVAYEPVWAIGTGQADTPDNATRRAIYIRKLLTKLTGARRASEIRILYGGSVNARNAASFLSSDIRGMDGLLIGGASLEAEEFVKIVRSVAELARRR